jgi:hypothetical protein
MSRARPAFEKFASNDWILGKEGASILASSALEVLARTSIRKVN